MPPVRREALGEAMIGFAVTLPALDLRLSEITPAHLAAGPLALLSRLRAFLCSVLVTAAVPRDHPDGVGC